jgi:hypothetical protein
MLFSFVRVAIQKVTLQSAECLGTVLRQHLSQNQTLPERWQIETLGLCTLVPHF